jgi:hypothetical protein
MRLSLKHLLLWLLIAVLPLQGFAAVMLHGWTMPAPAMAAMPAMDHAAMAVSGHDACMDASPAAVLLGLPDFTLPLDAPDVHQAWIITPVAGHIPDGLERPPKRFSI